MLLSDGYHVGNLTNSKRVRSTKSGCGIMIINNLRGLNKMLVKNCEKSLLQRRHAALFLYFVLSLSLTVLFIHQKFESVEYFHILSFVMGLSFA